MQEQENVAGVVVVVVVRRGVFTAGPHDGAGESLKLNLAPHGPFRMPACAPPSLVAAAPPEPQQRQRNLDEPSRAADARGVSGGGARPGTGRARAARTAGARRLPTAAEAGESEQRREERGRSGGS